MLLLHITFQQKRSYQQQIVNNSFLTSLSQTHLFIDGAHDALHKAVKRHFHLQTFFLH